MAEYTNIGPVTVAAGQNVPLPKLPYLGEAVSSIVKELAL